MFIVTNTALVLLSLCLLLVVHGLCPLQTCLLTIQISQGLGPGHQIELLKTGRPLLMFTPKCPLKVEISQGLAHFSQTEYDY